MIIWVTKCGTASVLFYNLVIFNWMKSVFLLWIYVWTQKEVTLLALQEGVVTVKNHTSPAIARFVIANFIIQGLIVKKGKCFVL